MAEQLDQGYLRIFARSWPDPDSVLASGTVAGGLSVPLLTAGAVSSTNKWIAGQALVVQGYDYTGTGPETLQLEWALTGDIVNPDNDSITGLSVFVGAFDSNALVFPDLSSPLNAFFYSLWPGNTPTAS